MIIQPLWNILNGFVDNEVEVCINNSTNNLVAWEKVLEDEDIKRKIENKGLWIETIKEEKEGLKTEGEDEQVKEKSPRENNKEDEGNWIKRKLEGDVSEEEDDDDEVDEGASEN